jgi:superfamily II DNA helicase RecQ
MAGRGLAAKLARRRKPIDRASVTDLHQLLHDRFGFSHFRGVQEAVVERAVEGCTRWR